MTKRFSKLTSSAVIVATALGLVLSPVAGLANTPTKTKRHHTQVVQQPTRPTVQFQGETPAQAWDDNDGFYAPPRSPGFNELNH
jgi:hypothetical protein